MQSFHVVCHVAHSGSRLTAGRIGKTKNELEFFTSLHLRLPKSAKIWNSAKRKID